MRKYQFSPPKPANEAKCPFRTIEVERLTANELFIVSRFCYKSSSRSSVPVGITSTCHCCRAAVCASRAAVKSSISCRMASKVMAGVSDVDVLLGGILSTKDVSDVSDVDTNL
ncbi:hypothetical protein Tco_0710116 [Tanacetum coccineum]